MNQIRKDCFAYQDSSTNGCGILKELYCTKENCKFYKTDRNGKYPNQLSDRENFNLRRRGLNV